MKQNDPNTTAGYNHIMKMTTENDNDNHCHHHQRPQPRHDHDHSGDQGNNGDHDDHNQKHHNHNHKTTAAVATATATTTTTTTATTTTNTKNPTYKRQKQQWQPCLVLWQNATRLLGEWALEFLVHYVRLHCDPKWGISIRPKVLLWAANEPLPVAVSMPFAPLFSQHATLRSSMA